VKKKYKEQVLPILLSLHPNFLAIASGATPIGSAVAHPIEKSQQKRMKRVNKKGQKEVEIGDKRKR
jgi:hypothetical protein